MIRRARILLLTALLAVVASEASAVPLASPLPVVPLPVPSTAPPSPAVNAAPGPLIDAATDPARLGERQLLLETEAADRAVARQELRVETAAQAHEDMMIDLARLRARMADVRDRHDRLRREAAERAVALYVNPGDDLVEHLLDSNDLNEAVLRQAFTANLQASSQTVGDQLRRTERDLRELEASAEASETEAGAAAENLSARAADLAPLQERRVRLTVALRQRIEALTAEASGHAANEEAILRVIAEEAAPPPPVGTPPAPVPTVVWPADGEVTSEFGMRWGVLHRGIDVAGSEGTPVVAALPGRVIEAGWTSGYGLTVIVDHGQGSTTLYAHLSAIEVDEGAEVGPTTTIGAMGSTGNSTGPHLHFETRLDGEAHDPRELLP
jgi:murein DD-endopeptidase MepM/ murein hydrolase activator NlpD